MVDWIEVSHPDSDALCHEVTMFSRLTPWMALCACVLFTLTPAWSQTPASIVAVNPSQTVPLGSMPTLTVVVRDASSAGVAGQTVTFTALTAGLTFLTSSTPVTNASGYASVTVMVPSVAGTHVVNAYVGSIGPATFYLFVGGVGGGTGIPASIIAETPTQTLALGGTATLRVRVLDAGSLPVAYQVVNFTTSAPGATFLTATSQYTDANGYAQAQLVVPSVAGTYLAYAYTGSLSPATFTLYVGTGGVTTGVGMQIYSGNGQLVTPLSPTTLRPLTVIVRDLSGTPVPGVYVYWQVTSGVAGLLQTVSVTDSTGQAWAVANGNTAIAPGVNYEQATIMASSSYGTVSFVLTTLGKLPDGTPIGASPRIVSPTADTPIVGKAGQTLSAAIQVVVYTTTNVAIPNVGLDVTGNLDPNVGPVASCTSRSVLTNASGYAQCDLVFGRTTGEGTLTLNVGGVLSRSLNFSVTPGDPASIVLIQGDAQSGSPGQTLPLELVAEVRDASGNPLQGVAVLWEWGVTDPAGARLLSPSQVTNSAGRVSTRVTLGTRSGELIVRVRAASNTSIMASFTLRAIQPVAGMAKVSGDNQTAIVNQAFAAPLVVEVRNVQMSPLTNVTVTFAVTSGSATLSSTTVVTGSDGRASVNVTAGAAAGAISVSATADSQAVVFSLTSRLPGPVLTASSFLNGASFRPGLVPGSLTAILGSGLAPGIRGCVGPGTVFGPLPTKVADVEVLLGSTLAPIYAVCNVSGQEQVVVQAPWEMAPGFSVMARVTVSGGSTVVERVPVLAALPGIFETSEAGGLRYAVAVGSDGRLITPTQRAKKGEVVYLYVTGLGTVLPLSATNLPGFPGQKAWFTVIAGIASKGVRVVSAEYAVNLLGVYVVAIEIPADAPSGIDVLLALGVVLAEGQAPVFAPDSRIPIQ